MNKIIKGLLVTALAMSGSALAHNHTARTFLMPRPTGVDLPMEYTTYESLLGRKDDKKHGANYEFSVFYKDSDNGHELAKYFLVNNKSRIKLDRAATPTVAKSTVEDVDLGYLIHDYATRTANITYHGHISLDPEIDSYGVRMDYHQDMDKILKGLYLKVNLPIVCVETNAKIHTSSTTQIPSGVIYQESSTEEWDVKDALTAYFNGTFYNDSAYNQQDFLRRGLITGKHDKTGVADIDMALGYKFLNKDWYYASIAFGVTMPTGNRAEGIYMFEPMIGNGRHWGIGGDFDAQVRVWKSEDQNLKLNLFMKYRYLLEEREWRTARIYHRDFSQYFLLGRFNANFLIPAANILTQKVDVTPGSQFDGIFGLAYNNGGFALDLGYNLYYREKEQVHYKNTKGNYFNEKDYQIAARNLSMAGAVFNPTVASNVDGGDVTAHPTALHYSDLSKHASESQSQFTNSIYGGFGYYFSKWENPLMLGLGGKYEWASENSAAEQWTIYGKIGFGF